MQGSDTQKKHCFTRGLIERLKLREVSNEGVDRKRFGSSSLPILIWESPLLAKLYKITFIARIESDGREGLGFRFDDTISESPRDIVWGGNVGTIDSPLCFLDGSQTFVTQSFSKASERCRRGWHVRIGKVSEIIRAFENSEESLVMKLSIRKLDSNTKPIRLDPQPPIIKPPQYSFNDFRYPPHYPLPKAPKLNTPSYQQRIPEPFSSKSLNCNYLSRSNSLLTPPTTPVLGMDDAQSASLAPAEKIEENEMSKADNVPEDESIPEEKPEPEGDLVAEDSPVPEENLVAEDSPVPEEDLVAEDSPVPEEDPVPKGEPIPEEEMSESPLRDDSQDQVDPSDEPEVANVVEASKLEDNEQLENFEDKEVENLCQPEEVSGDMTPEPVTVIEGSLKPQDSDRVVCLAFGGSNGTVGTRVLYVPLEIVKPIEYFRKRKSAITFFPPIF
ncbi:hypothetical protein BY996DRAFT_3892358 [Phakopsora pachyrhizi]|nr:hypothetical protein BY996DRAFT_3892358 [Phakopsora pachyrhizi]